MKVSLPVLCALPALAGLAQVRSEWTAINPVTPLTVGSFLHPPAADQPWVRLNMPADADAAELGVEVQQLHDAGIAGIEVGQGAFPNNDQLVAILKAANRAGVKVSLSHGPTQNPAGYSIDSDNARQSLFLGKATVDGGGTFDGPLPAPTLTQGSHSGFGGAGGRANAPAGAGRGGAGRGAGRGGPQATRTTLVALLAYRCAPERCAETGPVSLDRASAINLTAAAAGKNAGSFHWVAPARPAGAQWQLIAFWSRGVFAQPDPFSSEGYNELIASMESGLSAEVKALLKLNGGDIFYDSHSSDRGSPDELWTARMAEEFAARRRYPLIPNLPALFREQFDFADGSAPRIRDDFYQVRGDLWLEKQIAPLRTWVRKYNNVLRVQVEGEANLTIPITDMIAAAAAVDRPEHENLFVGDEIDNYLPMASANHMTGNTWYSTECCAAFGQIYAQTWQDTVIRMHRSYAGGITKLVYHVYPYRDGAASKWPGYSNFGQAGFSNAWGPREPFWADARLYNAYFARLQQALTQGSAKTDVAVFMLNYLYPPSQVTKTRHWGDTALAEAGYTRDYLDPDMLSLPNATVDGKRLAPDGPDYKALVIDSEQGPPTDPVKTSMPIETARKTLAFAKDGLPVIIVGAPPDRTPGNTPESDGALRSVIAELTGLPSVARVAHEADVPAKLRALGIRPAADPGAASSLLSVRRRDDATRTEYYFFYNQGVVSPQGEPANLFEPATGEPIEREVSLEGVGTPYMLDAWSGKITPVAQYAAADGRVTLKIRLSRDNATLIALSEAPSRFGAAGSVHVTQSDAAEVISERGQLLVHATKPGTYSTTLSNGRTIRSTVAAVPAPIDLTKAAWHVVAEDWQPANPYATTFGPAAAQTRKDRLELDLAGLKPWPEILQLQNASGLATYTTAFDLPANWRATNGARISLGEVLDSFTLTVNGQPVAVDQLSGEADLGTSLKAGRNALAIRVATTLNNRLAKLDDDVAARGFVQNYGLIGPVTITPFVRVAVWSPATR